MWVRWCFTVGAPAGRPFGRWGTGSTSPGCGFFGGKPAASSGRRSCHTPCRWGSLWAMGASWPFPGGLSSPQAMVRGRIREARQQVRPGCFLNSPLPGAELTPCPHRRFPWASERSSPPPEGLGSSSLKRLLKGAWRGRPPGCRRFLGPRSSPGSGSLVILPLSPEGERRRRIAQSAVRPACQPVCQRMGQPRHDDFLPRRKMLSDLSTRHLLRAVRL